VTGTTHEVRMIGDEKGYRFEPANLNVKAGDGVKFIMVSGGPHNVAFDEASMPAGAKDQLNANIPNPAAPLSSQMYMNPNEEFVISFANVAPGTYNYVCTPHQAMGMKGAITFSKVASASARLGRRTARRQRAPESMDSGALWRRAVRVPA
jgi:plastocyanin